MRTTGRYIEDLRTRLAKYKRENRILREGLEAHGIRNPEALGELMEHLRDTSSCRSTRGRTQWIVTAVRLAARVRGEVKDE